LSDSRGVTSVWKAQTFACPTARDENQYHLV
jgi:hypothetical protein